MFYKFYIERFYAVTHLIQIFGVVLSFGVKSRSRKSESKTVNFNRCSGSREAGTEVKVRSQCRESEFTKLEHLIMFVVNTLKKHIIFHL